MAIKLEQKFKEIEDIVLGTETFTWAHGKEYNGPINLTSIIMYTPPTKNEGIISIVLAEKVPDKYTDLFDGENPLGVVMAELDDNYNLKYYDAKSKVLSNIKGTHCPNGTIDGLGTDFNKGNPYDILYRKTR